jgi:hypothetical protein
MTALHQTPDWAGQLKVSPIPARDKVFVSGWQGTGAAYRLELYSATGDLLLVNNKVQPSAGEPIPVDVSAFPAGFYWVVIRKGPAFTSFKISKK